MSFLNLNHMPDHDIRCQVISTALKMNSLGINHGKSGNVSARTQDGFVITPTGIAYEKLQPDTIVAMKIDSDPNGTFAGNILPSSEWRFHRDIYAERADVRAIVHTHSVAATAIAVHGRDIPAFHYMVAVAGGDSIRCAPYATFGTKALSDHALKALHHRQACLLAHHGVIACGVSLEKALSLAVEVEALAAVYLAACRLDDDVPLLSAAEMTIVLEKFRTYGQQTLDQTN